MRMGDLGCIMCIFSLLRGLSRVFTSLHPAHLDLSPLFLVFF